jgi:hypothetical protein
MGAMLAMRPYAISGIFRHATLNEIFSLIATGLTRVRAPREALLFRRKTSE